MGQSERAREKIEISDIPKLQEMTKELRTNILEFYNYEVIEGQQSPFRYKIFYGKNEYEMIFSEMGSFTIRPLVSSLYKKNPSPVFYLSIGKYSSSQFQWEDLEGNPCAISIAILRESINFALENYQKQI